MRQPRDVHQTAVLKILVYVKSSLGKYLMYKKHEYVRIFSYSDSDYAGDKGDRKSTLDCCTFVGGNFVTRRSKKSDVSKFSAEAEYRL